MGGVNRVKAISQLPADKGAKGTHSDVDNPHCVVFHIDKEFSEPPNIFAIGAESCHKDFLIDTLRQVGAESVLHLVKGLDVTQVAKVLESVPDEITDVTVTQHTRNRFPNAKLPELYHAAVADRVTLKLRDVFHELGLAD